MNYNELPEFQRELRRLSRKYRSLPTDIEQFLKIISAQPPASSTRFSILKQNELLLIVKARLACRYLRNSSLRIVFSLGLSRSWLESRDSWSAKLVSQIIAEQVSMNAIDGFVEQGIDSSPGLDVLSRKTCFLSMFSNTY